MYSIKIEFYNIASIQLRNEYSFSILEIFKIRKILKGEKN